MTGRPPEGAPAGMPDPALWLRIFDVCPLALMYLDCEGRVVRVNSAMAGVLGCRPEEAEGRFCFELMHGAAAPVAGCPVASALQSAGGQSAEVLVERLGGFFHVDAVPVLGEGGRMAGLLHVVRAKVSGRGEPGHAGRGDPVASAEAHAKELGDRLFLDRLLSMMARRLGPAVLGVELRELIRHELARFVTALGWGRCVVWESRDDTLQAVARYENEAERLPRLGDTVTRASDPFLFSSVASGGFARTLDEGLVRCVAGKTAVASSLPLYLLSVECREFSPGCAFLYEDALRLMCEVVGGMLQHAADAADTQRLRVKLVQADRVARLGHLTATLAHELNQPLAATLCNAQAAVRLLEQNPPDVKEALSALSDIVESARHAGTVMRHTRAMFKNERVNRLPCNLNQLVNGVVGLLRGDIALAGATVTLRLDPSLPSVLADETQMQQVIRNLVLNACDAVSDRPRRQRNIQVRTGACAGGCVELCVQDSGCGIAESMEEKIFEPFFTTKPEGQGMGLPICRQIVTNTGGRIAAERVPAGGTLFRIQLPVLQLGDQPLSSSMPSTPSV